MQDKRMDDYWNVNSNRILSDSWKGFTKFTLLKENFVKGYLWSGGRLTKVQATTGPDTVCGLKYGPKLGKPLRREKKQEWANEKPKLDNAQRMRGIYFIDPEDEGESWKCIWTGLCRPKRRQKKPHQLTGDGSEAQCILQGSENEVCFNSGSSWIHKLHPENHDDHMCRQRIQLNEPITIWFTSSFLCSRPWKPRMQRQQWTRNGRSSKRFQHGSWKRSRAKKEVILEAQRDKKTSTLLHWWTSVTSNAELEPQFQRYRGRVVFRGDIVKTTSGACAVFTERGSSASQVTAAKIMVVARLPGCDGQAADAVSAFAQETVEDAPRLRRIPKSDCPDMWIRLPRHKWPKSWENWRYRGTSRKTRVRTSTCGTLAGRKFYGNFDGKRCRIGNVFLFIENTDHSYRYTWMMSKWLDISRTWLPCGRTSDHVYLGRTQRECKPNEMVIEQCKEMFESRVSAGATEKLPGWEKPLAKIVAWSYDMQGHAQKDRAAVQSFKSVPGWSPFQEKRSLNQFENCQRYAHKLSWSACTWHE